METTKMSSIRQKRIKVMPIVRQGGWLSSINAQHDGLFMYTGATKEYCLPYSLSKRAYENPFETEEEREGIESELNLQPGALNIYKKTDNYWDDFRIKINKDGLVLNLQNPEDYLRFIMLKANKETIAPTYADRLELGTYQFALVDEDVADQERAKKAHTVKDAYKKLGQMEDSVETMANFLTVYGKKPGRAPKREFLISELDKLIENDLTGFMEIATDPDFEMKLIIEKAVQVGALARPTKTRYELPGGDLIANSMTEAVAYMKDPLNQENYVLIKNRIEAAE
jgi:hypothetical protein